MRAAGVCVLLLICAIASTLEGVSSNAANNVTLIDINDKYSDTYTGPRAQDPDMWRNSMELLTSKGYQAEWVNVTTEDGYILGLLHITGAPSTSAKGAWRLSQYACKQFKPSILLQHGLIDSSAAWVLNQRHQSLGMVLADLGYDVWLGNSRGNSYSQRHAYYADGDFSGWEDRFWDFSWDQMAKYDVPANLAEIIYSQKSRDKLVGYVGHSQGTTQAFAAFSENEPMAKMVGLHVALAPVAFVSNTQALLFQLFGLEAVGPYLESFLLGPLRGLANTLLGIGGKNFMQTMIPSLCNGVLGGCTSESGNDQYDSGILGLLGGLPDMQHMNESRIPVYLSHWPDGTSVRNLMHWAQSVRSGQFRKYDYGLEANRIRYGTAEPPSYPLKRYSVPTVLVSGGKDPISVERDVEKLARSLPGDALIEWSKVRTYDHFDFTLADDGDSQLFPLILPQIYSRLCVAQGGDPEAARALATGSTNVRRFLPDTEPSDDPGGVWRFLVSNERSDALRPGGGQGT